jgi:hypothetical protein
MFNFIFATIFKDDGSKVHQLLTYINRQSVSAAQRSATYGTFYHIPKHSESSLVVYKCLIFL